MPDLNDSQLNLPGLAERPKAGKRVPLPAEMAAWVVAQERRLKCKLIRLTQGQFTLVDRKDFVWLNQWLWFYSSEGYAMRNQWNHGTNSQVFMHREILRTPDGFDTDHKNGNPLDNRRRNLRIATRTQNNGNRSANKNRINAFKGVFKQGRRWRAKIMNQHIGYFDSPTDAAKAYNTAALQHFGEFAKLNQV